MDSAGFKRGFWPLESLYKNRITDSDYSDPSDINPERNMSLFRCAQGGVWMRRK
jgi:hypothetical protein